MVSYSGQGTVSRTTRIAMVAVLALVIFSTVASATSHSGYSFMADCSYHDVREVLECTFLPQDTTLADGDTKMLLFGIVLPFLLVFAVLRLGLKNIFGTEGETDVIALVMALFIIPSGGYRYISELFLAIGGLGAEGFVGEPFSGLPEWQIQLLMSGLFGLLVTLGLMYKGDKDGYVNHHEKGVILAITTAFWIAIGGMESITASDAVQTTGEAIGLVVVMVLGFWIFLSARNSGGVKGTIWGLAGFFLIAWAFSNLPEEFGLVQELGQIIVEGGIPLLLIIAGIFIVVVIFIVLGSSGGGPGIAIAAAIVVIVLIVVLANMLMIPVVRHPRPENHHNIYKPAAETRD